MTADAFPLEWPKPLRARHEGRHMSRDGSATAAGAPGTVRITRDDARFPAALAIVRGNSPAYAEACRNAGYIDLRHDQVQRLKGALGERPA